MMWHFYCLFLSNTFVLNKKRSAKQVRANIQEEKRV